MALSEIKTIELPPAKAGGDTPLDRLARNLVKAKFYFRVSHEWFLTFGTALSQHPRSV